MPGADIDPTAPDVNISGGDLNVDVGLPAGGMDIPALGVEGNAPAVDASGSVGMNLPSASGVPPSLGVSTTGKGGFAGKWVKRVLFYCILRPVVF